MADCINNTEYIDRKELVNNINKFVKLTNKEEQEWVKDECVRQAYCIQKADVVPRSEVEELENRLDSLGNQYRAGAEFLCNQAKQEVAREIFEEIFALCNNAKEKLDVLFIEVSDYRKGYENSVKHFTENMEKLKKQYTGE